MAFKMKGTPLHYGTSSHKSALKHNSDELTRAQKNNGADWKHDESNHDHEGSSIWDKSKTEDTDTGTKTTQSGRKLGTTGETKCTTKGYKWNPTTKKCEKIEKDTPVPKSQQACSDEYIKANGPDACRKYKEHLKKTQETKNSSTDDEPLSRESTTTNDIEKGCVKTECKPDTEVYAYTWNQEQCKCIRTKKDPNQDCIDREEKIKKCKGKNRRWSSSECKCIFTGTGLKRGARKVVGGIKKVGRGVKKVGKALGRLFSKACPSCDCAAYADSGSETKMPEGHTSC